MDSNLIINIIMYLSIPISFTIGLYIGDKRVIGQIWATFFVITFGVIVGTIVVLCSKLINKNEIIVKNNRPSYLSIFVAILSGFFSFLLFIYIIITIEPAFNDVYKYDYSIDWNLLYRLTMFTSGFLGITLYLIQNRKAKPIKENPSKVEDK